jgi:aminoglycoside 6'-N-acetyltransferase I
MPVLKELTIKDIDSIKSFFKDVFMREPWNDDWSDDKQLHMYITDIIGNQNSLAFGLFEEEQLLGLALGNIKHWYTGTEFFVEEFCIKTEMQGKGLGTEFLRLLEESLREKEIKIIFLMTGKTMPAFAFYRKNGFEEIINHVSLKKDI